MLALDTTPLPKPRRLPLLLAILVLTAVVGTAGELVAARRVADNISRVAGMSAVLDAVGGNFENYLLVGSDSRALGDPNTGTGGEDIGSRSDTIIVLRVDNGNGTAALLSIPRDLYVETSVRTGRINGAYNDGPATLVQAVQEALAIPVHHYVEVDFFGFKALVEALGGVEVCFALPARDVNTGLDIAAAGCHVLDGTQALAYARSRHYEELRADGEWHEDPTSDLGRSTRQRDFINRCLQQAVAQVKVNPFDTGDLVRAMGNAISIDDELDPINAAASLRTAVGEGLATYSLPVVPDVVGGDDVLLLDDDATIVLDFFRGTGLAPAPTT
ncbi:MAG: LCP family protein [Actinobacteria bacterium]|nr:LCP family protein [Actinomycetota bacterium]